MTGVVLFVLCFVWVVFCLSCGLFELCFVCVVLFVLCFVWVVVCLSCVLFELCFVWVVFCLCCVLFYVVFFFSCVLFELWFVWVVFCLSCVLFGLCFVCVVFCLSCDLFELCFGGISEFSSKTNLKTPGEGQFTKKITSISIKPKSNKNGGELEWNAGNIKLISNIIPTSR